MTAGGSLGVMATIYGSFMHSCYSSLSDRPLGFEQASPQID